MTIYGIQIDETTKQLVEIGSSGGGGSVEDVVGTAPITVTGTTTKTVALADGGINTAKLADDAVTQDKIADNAVGNAQLQDDAVGTAEIQDNAITNALMADNAIGTAELIDANVTAAKLATDSVITAKIQDAAVNDDKIGDRTANQATGVAFSNTGKLTQFLSWFAKQLKAILGTTDWFGTPPTDLTTTAAHIASTTNPHSVTATQVGALVSVDGVSNAGGNIDLIAGAGITITPDDGANNITIAATGGGGVTDHGALTGLGDDDHSQYGLLAGRAGGQILRGGTATGDDLTLYGTANATDTGSQVTIAASSQSDVPKIEAKEDSVTVSGSANANPTMLVSHSGTNNAIQASISAAGAAAIAVANNGSGMALSASSNTGTGGSFNTITGTALTAAASGGVAVAATNNSDIFPTISGENADTSGGGIGVKGKGSSYGVVGEHNPVAGIGAGVIGSTTTAVGVFGSATTGRAFLGSNNSSTNPTLQAQNLNANGAVACFVPNSTRPTSGANVGEIYPDGNGILWEWQGSTRGWVQLGEPPSCTYVNRPNSHLVAGMKIRITDKLDMVYEYKTINSVNYWVSELEKEAKLKYTGTPAVNVTFTATTFDAGLEPLPVANDKIYAKRLVWQSRMNNGANSYGANNHWSIELLRVSNALGIASLGTKTNWVNGRVKNNIYDNTLDVAASNAVFDASDCRLLDLNVTKIQTSGTTENLIWYEPTLFYHLAVAA